MQVIAILEPHKTALALIASLLISAGMVSCGELSEEQTQQIDEALQDSLTSTTETWNVDMELIEEGAKKIRLWGSYAATFTENGDNQTRIKGPVKIHVFDTTGAVKTEVFSDSAVYQPQDAIFEFFGNVEVNTVDSRHLQSEYLEWSQDDNSIQTPRFVIVMTPTDSIAGTGFEGNTDLTDYTIKEPKGRVVVD